MDTNISIRDIHTTEITCIIVFNGRSYTTLLKYSYNKLVPSNQIDRTVHSNPNSHCILSNNAQLDVKKILNDNQRVSTSITFENP